MQRPNIIVTYDPTHAAQAQQEVERVVKADFIESGFEGVFLLHFDGDYKKAVRDVAAECAHHPYNFKFTSKWVPIDHWCPSQPDEIRKVLAEFDGKIRPEDSWMMEISKRGYEGDTFSLLEVLTRGITKPKVDLKKPDVIIRIEIVGDHAGVSLLHKDDMLFVSRQKS